MDSSGRVAWTLVGLGALALVVALPPAVRTRFEGAYWSTAADDHPWWSRIGLRLR